MQRDANELRNALIVIKEECQSHTGCAMCPFLVGDYDCGITGIRMSGNFDYKKMPKYWNIPRIQLLAAADGK